MKKSIILISIITLIILMILGVGAYYFFSNSQNAKALPGSNIGLKKPPQPKQVPATPPPAPAKELERLQAAFPEVITGIIKFSGTANSFTATLKTDSGTEYILMPTQPKSVYESFGVEDGSRIQLNGKILTGNQLNWVLMKPI